MDRGLIWSPEVEDRLKAVVSLDRQERAQTVQVCKRCVMTSQRPRITFDKHGICSACRYADYKKTVDWESRAEQLNWLLYRNKRESGYDVVVPCSGGKDSSYVAHKLKHEHGMRPLCVKWAPFIYTDIGRKNMDSFIHSGFDVLVMHPNGIIHRKLARLALEYFGDPFIPFIYGQLAWPMHVANMLGINLVMFGENGEAEYGGDSSANEKPCWDTSDWERIYMKGAGLDKLLALGQDIGALSSDEIKEVSQFYRPPETGAEFHWFGYYTPWHPQGNYYYAAEHTGFEANDERSQGTYSKYASLDDKLDGLHYYFGYLKFGIGRCTSDAAHEVRDGDLERDEALALVKKYDGEFPERHLDECLEYLGMDREQLDRVIARFSSDSKT